MKELRECSNCEINRSYEYWNQLLNRLEMEHNDATKKVRQLEIKMEKALNSLDNLYKESEQRGI